MKKISEIRNVIVNSLITAEGLGGSLVPEISLSLFYRIDLVGGIPVTWISVQGTKTSFMQKYSRQHWMLKSYPGKF